MRRAILALLAVMCLIGFTVNAYAEGLVRGDIAYVRSNLRAEGYKIVWHNMSSLKGLIPVGTEVKIKGSSGGLITFVTNDTNKTYYIYASSERWDKFFVKNKKDIGLDGLSPDQKKQVENCDVLVGMTKDEVYASKGCPAYIAWGVKSESKSFAEIMQSDKWYYMTSSRGHDVMATFQDGKVIKTGGFEK